MDFQTLRLTAKPNQYLVAPEGLCAQAKPYLAAPEYAIAPTALRAIFRDIALAQPRVVQTGADEATLTDTYVQRSAFLGFPDTITVRFLTAGTGRSSLAIIAARATAIRIWVSTRRVSMPGCATSPQNARLIGLGFEIRYGRLCNSER